jgi:phage N-6-adenine-methyltransferase
MNTDVMFSSKNEKWETPASVISDLSTVFAWTLDVCASRPNVCERYFSPDDDALTKTWHGLCWMNPPYGRQIGRWMLKARTSDATVVCLVPARTDTRWWQESIRASALSLVVHIAGRLTFGSDAYWADYWNSLNEGGHAYNSKGEVRKNAAPFPNAFMVFGHINQEQRDHLVRYGYGISLRDYRGEQRWTHPRAELILPGTR